MDKLLVVCGPTATGKTSLGIKLAKEFNGEIISADSRQVYKGMNIGTGKDLNKFSVFNLKFLIPGDFRVGFYTIEKVPVWLLDIVSPKYQFNVADWLKCAAVAINDILKRKKMPIVVGGTGFYLKALISNIGSLTIKPDKKLRKKLERFSLERLQQELKKIAPSVYRLLNNSDRNNPRRLIRKIELATSGFVEGNRQFEQKGDFNGFQVGLRGKNNKSIYKRIDLRIKERLKQGLLEEIQSLLKEGISWSDPGMNTLAYKEFEPFFSGGAFLEECLERWRFDEHAYARRQLTWFKKDKRIKWFNIEKDDYFAKLVAAVRMWYSRK